AIWLPVAAEGATMQMMLGNGFGFNWQGLYVTSMLNFHNAWRNRADELSDSLKNTMLLGHYMVTPYPAHYYPKAQELDYLPRRCSLREGRRLEVAEGRTDRGGRAYSVKARVLASGSSYMMAESKGDRPWTWDLPQTRWRFATSCVPLSGIICRTTSASGCGSAMRRGTRTRCARSASSTNAVGLPSIGPRNMAGPAGRRCSA